MEALNTGKVLRNGVLAGSMIVLLGVAVNSLSLQLSLHDTASLLISQPAANLPWLFADIIGGLLIVTVYGACGRKAGLGLALIASVVTWLVLEPVKSQIGVLDVTPASLLMNSTLGAFVGSVIGGPLGCLIYRFG